MFSSFQINVPQLYADVDRARAKRLGVPLTDVFETMQINLGSVYVNDFNRFGKTYRVIVQADAPYRSSAEDIAALKTRNAEGELVPLGAVLKVADSFGPDRAMRYNSFPSADLNGAAAPVLLLYFPDDQVFRLTTAGQPDRVYTSIARARSDGNNGRIWGGMHFPSTIAISDREGEAIARYVNANSMQRIQGRTRR